MSRATAPTTANPDFARVRSRSSRHSRALSRVTSREPERRANSAHANPPRPRAPRYAAPVQLPSAPAIRAPRRKALTRTRFVAEMGSRSTLFNIEYLLNCLLEVPRQLGGQPERRVVSARLDGIDRLACNAERSCESTLGHACGGPQATH